MKGSSTLTVGGGHWFRVGDQIRLSVKETRWWILILFWMFRRVPPLRAAKKRIVGVGKKTIEIV